MKAEQERLERLKREEEEARRRAAEEETREQELEAERARARADAEERAQARREQRAAEKAEADARAAAREREREREAAEVASRLQRIRRGKPRGGKTRWLGLIALVAVIVAVVAVRFVPIDPAPHAAWASRALGVPVQIGAASYALEPLPVLQLKAVRIGNPDDVRVGTVSATPALSSWFGDGVVFTRLELSDVRVKAQALGALLRVSPSARVAGLPGIALTQVVLEIPGATLPPLAGRLEFGAAGAKFSLEDTEKKLSLDLLPLGDGNGKFELWATDARALSPALPLTDLRVRGTASREQARIERFDARLHDGVVQGQGVLTWGEAWRFDGTVEATSLTVAKLAPAVEGRLKGSGRFAMQGADFGALFAAPGLDASFAVEQGLVSGFDLPRSLQAGAVTPGTTSFNDLSGQAVLEQGRLKLRGLRLRAGVMNASGNLDLAGGKVVDGRIAAELRIPAGFVRANFGVAGTPAALNLQR